MTISYNWLNAYLPVKVDPERLSQILTSVGLEVEKMENFEEVKGGLEGLIIGEVIDVQPHPNADKLRLTKVATGQSELQIVCGAPNVAVGQKVVVAPVGATIYPISGEPLTMKVAKIRGVESYGMICAEDEIGIGTSHAGIMVLPEDVTAGMNAAEYFEPYQDVIFDIGLTPNRMDAMSHWGVARDVCAYLSHHDHNLLQAVLPIINFSVDSQSLPIKVKVEDAVACQRYSAVCIADITVRESPKWLKDRLKSIGLRPINNIVDITNFIQHETGQPLHAFDYNAIEDATVVIKKLRDGTPFTTLDEKVRKLSNDDLMICDAKGPMCIAGVFGGLNSGVSAATKNIFLESAFFDPGHIRKTSFRHGLRTDAATRFEKGIDISGTITVLQRAAMLIKEIAGGQIASEIIDIYPAPKAKTEVELQFSYLKKLSGKYYQPPAVKKILESLLFKLVSENEKSIVLQVPYHKPDVTIAADIVEEIVRIDGLDNIEIPQTISISPSVEENKQDEELREKLASILTGMGFTEILTNSITNSAYYSENKTYSIVKLLNNLSSELDVLRPSMLHTALEVISFNINRKNSSLRFFEFGKTYSKSGDGQYEETDHLCLYTTGQLTDNHWKQKGANSDVYYLKGVAEALLQSLGLTADKYNPVENKEYDSALAVTIGDLNVLETGVVSKNLASKFDIRQPVFFADFYWDTLLKLANKKIQFRELSKYPAVERDLAIVIPKGMKYDELKNQLLKLKLNKLQEVKLFDVFESEKLGANKKSLAINFTFQDEEKTLTDKEIDGWMNKIMTTLEKELNAEIRKQ